MNKQESSKFTDLTSYFSNKGISTHEFILYLSPYMDIDYSTPGNIAESSGTMEDIVIDKEGKTLSTSTKAQNVIFNVREAIINKDWQTLATVGELVPAANSVLEKIQKANDPTFGVTVLAALGVLLFLAKVNKLAKINLTTDEAILLTELHRLDVEENTVRRDDVPMILGNQLTNKQIDDALLNLDRLGCIKLSLDEIILIEKIRFR